MSSRELSTVITIDGVMSDTLRKAVNEVNKQLGSIDKQALATASKLGNNITQAAKTAAKAVAGIGIAAASAAAGLFVKTGQDYIRTMNGIQAQTGDTGEELKDFGQIAQDIYKTGKGESFQEIADALVNIRQSSKLAGDELKTAANAALLLKDSFGMETEETTRAATALMKNFGISAEEAYGLIAYGAQNGANRNGDLLDILNEYSVHYKALGLDANQFVDTLVKGADAGSFSIDKIGDAIKEFNIRSKDASDSSAEAFKALGLNANNMFAQFAAGGNTAEAAFFQTVQALNAIEDPVKKNTIGVALFGTMFEDLEAGILNNFSNISGAAIDATETLRQIERVKYNDVGYAISQIGRTFETALIPSAEAAGQAIFDKMPEIQASIAKVMPTVSALGAAFAAAIPGIIDAVGSAAGVLKDFGAVVAGNWDIIRPILLTAGGLFATIKLVEFAKNTYAVGKALTQLTLAYGRLYIAKAKDMIQTAQIYALYAKDAIAKGLVTARTYAAAAAQAAQTVATVAWTTVCTIATTATTALGAAVAFLTSPIGLAVAAIAGLIAAGVLLYKNWDTVKAKAAEVGAWISAKWQGMKDAVTGITGALSAALSAQWAGIKSTVSGYVGQLGDFVGNVWTKIKDGAISLGTGVKDAFVNAFSPIAGIIKAPINAAITLINKAISGINGIGFTVPDWIPGIGGKAFSVSIPSVPMLAKGGFTNGLSIAGEAGQEAVISFDPAYRQQNIGYLNEAASRLGVGSDSVSSYADRIESLGSGMLAANTNITTTYNLGGITFSPTVTVAGAAEKKEQIIEQLRNYQGELLDLIEELLQQKEAGSYGASGVF